MANGKSVIEKVAPVEDDDLHCQTLVWNHIMSSVDCMVLKCALKLHLFDVIHRHGGDLPISLMDLAAALPMRNNRLSILHRIMRYLAHLRLVNVHQEESYTLTKAASTYLIEGAEKSHTNCMFFLEEDMFAPLHALDASLVSEVTPFEIMKGEPIFKFIGRDPELIKRFDDGMMCTVMPTIEAVLKGYPEVFEGVNVLVDVGGGTGMVAASIAREFASIRCIVYDQPHVVQGAPKSKGVEYAAGDMTASVPHADALLLMRVLHDFDDDKAIQILNRCREAIIEEEGKVIIIEVVFNKDDTEELNHVKLTYDMFMMAYAGGKERTEKEWSSLLLKAGFTRCNIRSVKALHHVIEARP